MTTSRETKDLNFRGIKETCLPRMLWQRLFNFYQRRGDNSDLDSLLIDYDNCKGVIHSVYNLGAESLTFLWGFHYDDSITYWKYENMWGGNSPQLLAEIEDVDWAVVVTVTKNKTTFEIVRNEEIE